MYIPRYSPECLCACSGTPSLDSCTSIPHATNFDSNDSDCSVVLYRHRYWVIPLSAFTRFFVSIETPHHTNQWHITKRVTQHSTAQRGEPTAYNSIKWGHNFDHSTSSRLISDSLTHPRFHCRTLSLAHSLAASLPDHECIPSCSSFVVLCGPCTFTGHMSQVWSHSAFLLSYKKYRKHTMEVHHTAVVSHAPQNRHVSLSLEQTCSII